LFSLGRSLSGKPNALYRVEPGALLASGRPYVQHPTSFWRSSNGEGLLEIPTSTDVLRLLPAVTFALDLMLPRWARETFLRTLMASPAFINVVLHDFEFLYADDFAHGTAVPLTTSLMFKGDVNRNSARYSLLAAAAKNKEMALLKSLVAANAPAAANDVADVVSLPTPKKRSAR
jgi:hypothetical protein